MMRRLLLGAVLLAGCAPTINRPPPAPERGPTAVAAAFAKSWDAVVDVFATRSIPIATIERASGIITAQTLRATNTSGTPWAICPQVIGMLSAAEFYPAEVNFNVLVREATTGSTVRVTARWIGRAAGYATAADCESTGVWETELEVAIKAAAEAGQ